MIDDAIGDIMCGVTTGFRDGEYEVPYLPLEDARVKDLTAKEIGWTDIDGDDIVSVLDTYPFDPTRQ